MLLFSLLQVALGNRSDLPAAPSAEEWEEVYALTKEHALTGIAFAALERLPQEQLPPPRRIRQWAVKADRIKEANQRLSRQTAEVQRLFEKNGFRCAILKGQGNMLYYPEHLRGLREAGDIDAWVWPHDEHEGDDRDVVRFCLSRRKGEFIYYHNMDFPLFADTPVEVHYRPTWLYTPWRNARLQRWLREERQQRFAAFEGYLVPTAQFNVVFQLLHIYKHIFEEGIGLRQLLDYYLLLRQCRNDINRREALELFRRFGVEAFARAVMHVLQTVFSPNDDTWMLCPADEGRGSQLLHEIMLGGNFGQYDARYHWADTTNGSMRYRGLPYAWARLRHNMRFLRSYPLEVLFEPPFRLYNKLYAKYISSCQN